MTYDDWKLMSDRDAEPQPDAEICFLCNHVVDGCDCPCCHEEPQE